MKPQRSEGRGKAVWGGRTRNVALLVLSGALLWLPGCSQTTRTGQASSYLVIMSLQGGRGDSGELGSSLSSDVVTVDEATGALTIFGDRGQVDFALQMKDPGGLAPSPVNNITVTQYHVEYVRSDGRNTPGVDVPHPFDGAVTVTVTGGGGGTGFTLVRNQAKSEAPLRALRFGGGAGIISTIARVTFYGRDQTGREVSVTGNISVNFADWGDQ